MSSLQGDHVDWNIWDVRECSLVDKYQRFYLEEGGSWSFRKVGRPLATDLR
jgi:hypothetical protein